jgi:trigger factor
VGDSAVWEELSLAVTGLAAGQEGRFTRRPVGDDAPARSFRVRVARVEERDLPPLDDALAARVGAFADVAELRERVTADVRRLKREARRREREKALLEQLRARHPITLPQGVVRHEVEHLLRDYADELGRRGLDPQTAQVDWDALGERVRPQAERRVHERLLLDAIAEREAIAVGDDELEATVAALARAQGINPGLLRKRFEESGRLEGLRHELRRGRVVRRLLADGPDEETAAEDGA